MMCEVSRTFDCGVSHVLNPQTLRRTRAHEPPSHCPPRSNLSQSSTLRNPEPNKAKPARGFDDAGASAAEATSEHHNALMVARMVA